MNKQSLTGLIIIGIILFGFSWYGSYQAKEVAKEKAAIDSVNNIEAAKTNAALEAQQKEMAQLQAKDSSEVASKKQTTDSPSTLSYVDKYLNGEEEFFTLENDNLIATISNKGGAIVSVELKNYTTYDGKPLYLFNKEGSVFDMLFFTNQRVETSRYFFTPVSSEKNITVTEDESKNISFRLYADSLSYIEYSYKLSGDSYMVDFNVSMVGMDKVIAPNQTDISILWSNISPQQEQGYEYENNYTTVAYKYASEDQMDELTMSTSSRDEILNSKTSWVAFKQQFFSSIFVAKNDFVNGNVGFKTLPQGSGDIKHFNASLTVPYSQQTSSYDFSFYFGPNNYTTLKKFDEGFEKLIPLGWGIFGWVNRFIVIPTFNFLGEYMTNYGLIILLLTIFIKLIIFPFTYKSYLSMAKMRLLKPEMDEINGKYPKKDDAMKKQQALMDLYRRAGVNPMGGCLPMLFQLPILIAMFRFFPASIELRQQHFLWANDLSSYDSILNLPFNIPFYGDHVSLFALLMGISVFVSSKLNFEQSSAASSNQMPGMKFMTLYMMPVMLVLWFNNYSSGLSYYYFLSNLITIGQSYGFRRLVDDKKLHQQMKDNAKKPKKKSKFQQRYEDMVKQQQEMAKQRNKK